MQTQEPDGPPRGLIWQSQESLLEIFGRMLFNCKATQDMREETAAEIPLIV